MGRRGSSRTRIVMPKHFLTSFLHVFSFCFIPFFLYIIFVLCLFFSFSLSVLCSVFFLFIFYWLRDWLCLSISFPLNNFLSRVPLYTETEESRGRDARRFPLHCKGRRTWVEQTGRLTHGVLLNVEGSKFIFIITLSNLAEALYGLTRSDFTEVNDENTEAVFMRGWHRCFSLVRLFFLVAPLRPRGNNEYPLSSAVK